MFMFYPYVVSNVSLRALMVFPLSYALTLQIWLDRWDFYTLLKAFLHVSFLEFYFYYLSFEFGMSFVENVNDRSAMLELLLQFYINIFPCFSKQLEA